MGDDESGHDASTERENQLEGRVRRWILALLAVVALAWAFAAYSRPPLSGDDAQSQLRTKQAMIEALERGDAATEHDLLSAAREHYERAFELAEELRARTPTSPESRRDVAVSINRLAFIAQLEGELDTARASFLRSLKIFEGLQAEHPNDETYRLDVASSLKVLGLVEEQAGDQVAAKSAYQRSLGQLDELRGPAVRTQCELELAQVLVSLANVELGLSEPDAAREHFDRALPLFEKYAGGDTKARVAKKGLVSVLRGLMSDAERSGDLSTAHARATRALALLNELQEAAPHDGSLTIDRALVQDSLGRIGFINGDHEAARVHFESARSLLEARRERDSSSTVPLRNLHLVLGNLGKLHHASGELTRARESYTRSATLCEELHTRYPDNAAFAGELGYMLQALSQLELEVGDSETARGHAERALSLYEPGLRRDSADLDARMGVVRSHLLLVYANDPDDEESRRRHVEAADEHLDAVARDGPSSDSAEFHKFRVLVDGLLAPTAQPDRDDESR